jgi:hypothetical protein
MLKEEIAPALRGLGFKGSGRVYALPVEGWWAQLGFQGHARYNTAESVRFTVNIHVVLKSDWESARVARSYLPARPSPNEYGGPGWQQRIGQVLPDGQDKWWQLEAGQRTNDVADEVVAAVREYVLPAMLREIRD